jgi:phytoene dehydrogenase-like protein
MGRKETLVVGSGAGGLTLALLLARAGRSVTLLESQPEIGGYLRRFTRDGVRFDTGYHFSGGYTNIMPQMLHVLGMDDAVRAEAISNRIILKRSGDELTVAAGSGYRGTEAAFSDHFAGDSAKLHQLFDAVREIWRDTPMRDLTNLTPPALDISRYDMITVDDFCGSIGLGAAAKTAAGCFAMCHGSLPCEAAMTFHARVGFAIFDDLARPVGGGDPVIAAFGREAEKLGITIRTGTSLCRFDDMDADGECRVAHLTDGTDLEVDQVFFAVHPLAVYDLLPERARTPSLCRRIRRLKESTSFFCSYYMIDDEVETTPGLVSLFSHNDLDAILRGENAYSTGYLLGREPDAEGRMRSTVAAFRTMLPGTPDAPATRRERCADAGYREFKERVSAEIADDLTEVYPELKGHLRPVAAGTPLTCRDYDPPTGCAYGVRNLCGQSRLCGRLPVRNFFIAGQSALVPGVMGTMLTSFTVFRFAVGEDVYCRLIRESGLV